tara:strand:+ start:5317 stop:6450 length:1134 start_codon:yes stop_codon:yes gene_type:complete
LSKNSLSNLPEVVKVFFRLGLIGFGGPAAHIAMMEEEVVSKRKWMSRQHFLDLMGATNLIPGPNSTEMTMHCGHERAGKIGLFAAGLAFIFPAVVLTLALAWFYGEYGEVPEIAPFFNGIQPAVIAIIFGAIFKLGKKAFKNYQLGIIGGLMVVAVFLGMSEPVAVVSSGIIAMLWFGFLNRNLNTKAISPLFLLFSVPLIKKISLSHIFLLFLKVGCILFGSGYVLIAYLDGELVDKLQWLSESQLLDAIAMGQFTPGPVLTAATFVGYQLQGFSGALAATAGIFLPSFIFVLILNPIIPKLSKSKIARSFLDGVNVGAVSIMLAVSYRLVLHSIVDWKSILILLFGIFFTFGPKKLSSLFIVFGGMVLGYLLSLV